MTEAEQSARSCEDTSSAQRSPQESAVVSANDADAGCTIRIENIPSQIDEYSLNQVMRHFGKVRQCRVVLGSTARDPAEAYVMFKRPAEAEAAVKADEKLECGGCTLKISLWKGNFPPEEPLHAKRILPPFSNDSCWFCVSNSSCEDHMIAYVSDESYIAIAKGAIVTNHSLVTPIYHYPSAASAPSKVLFDMQRLVDCLLDLCLKSGMGGIVFERYMPMQNPYAMHTQIQVAPVPLDRAMEAFDYVNNSQYFSGSRVERFDNDKGTSLTCLEGQIDGLNRSYFYLQAVGRDRSTGGGLVHSHCLWTLSRRIPITFGRELILHLLPDTSKTDLPFIRDDDPQQDQNWREAALDWRNCVTDKDSEAEMAQNLARAIISLAK
ncbi:putative CwfJ C-terminus 1-like protein [Babesia divergens]|uniref:CwfJ C-terminus 1-like protein n=1 Tax=Babesia divergens TaxID=32595 RepID=A0AAD9GD22_BABDI|nr:putative CwfJ C-terminus 1-like protein [Babesia divergens]